MTEADFRTIMVNALKIPIGFQKIAVGTQMPFGIYFSENVDNFGADNIVYHVKRRIELVIYESEIIDTSLHSLIESTLASNDIYWTRERDYVDDEKINLTTYTMEVL